MHPRDLKKQLRDAIEQRIARMSDKDKAAESRSLCRRVLEKLPPGPLTVCAYWAFKNEVDLRPLMDEILERGGSVYLPRFERDHFSFRKAADLTRLVSGPLNTMEPPADADLLDSAALQYALIPARAYDKQGRRMGRGNGGYDIWIRKQRELNPKTQFWGVAFECQIVPEIPMEGHDEHVDAVFTDRGIVTK